MRQLVRSWPRLAALFLIFASSSTIQATTLTVTNTNDSGPGSLRDAIALASSGDLIQFDPSLAGIPIVLTSGELLIDKDISIEGSGEFQTILDGNHSSRIFKILADVSAEFSELTIQNGWARECLDNFQTRSEGGGVYNAGHLTLHRVLVTRNLVDHRNAHCDEYYDSPESIRGAGVFNSGDLELRQSSLDGNASFGFYSYGGGLFNSGTASLLDSSVNGNYGEFDRYAGVQGAGIYNVGTAQLIRSMVAGNDIGKGIQNLGALTITDSSIGGNGGWRGGGLSGGNNVRILNSVFSGNWGGVGSDWGGISSGVSILENSAVVSNHSENGGGMSGADIVRNSTIANNEGYRYTAGIGSAYKMISSTVAGNVTGYGVGGTGWLGYVKNSVIAGNYNFNDPQPDCGGVLASLGHNIVGSSYGCPGIIDGINGDLTDLDWTLLFENRGEPYGRPLVTVADNGGSTLTAALRPDGPAIDLVPLSACTDEADNPLLTDQRGVARPQGTACDVGAFEFAQPRGEGFWAHQCRNNGYIQIDSAQLEALFATVADGSAVFPEFGSIDCATLDPTIPQNDLRARAQQELLATWLNLETGRLTRGRPIDLPNLTTARTVGEALGSLELTLCDPDATRNELGNAKSLAQALNNGIDDMELATTETSISLLPGSSRSINLGLVNMSPTSRNYSLLASGPWTVRLSTSRVNALASGDVAQITATITAPLISQSATAPIRFTATDLGTAGLSRDVIIIFKLAPASTSEPKKKLTQVD